MSIENSLIFFRDVQLFVDVGIIDFRFSDVKEVIARKFAPLYLPQCHPPKSTQRSE